MTKQKDDETFSPEETTRRFNALMTVMLRGKPMTQKELVAKIKRDGPAPGIHTYTTEEMEARARAVRVTVWQDEEKGVWVITRDKENVAFSQNEVDANVIAEAIRAKVEL